MQNMPKWSLGLTGRKKRGQAGNPYAYYKHCICKFNARSELGHRADGLPGGLLQRRLLLPARQHRQPDEPRHCANTRPRARREEVGLSDAVLWRTLNGLTSR
jgi:hypothetical protein